MVLDHTQLTISIVVPCYGAPNTLPDLHLQLTQVLQKMGCGYEIILVNDACPRGSWAKIQEICENDPQVRGINLVRNFGQHNAIACGLANAQGDYIVVMDCDLQDDPAHLPELLKTALTGYDVVVARRRRKIVSMFKRFQSWIFYKTLKVLLDVHLSHEVGNYGIYSRRTIRELSTLEDRVRFFPYLISWMGYKSTSIDVTQNSREEGSSSYSFTRLLKLAFEVSINSSMRPLTWSIYLGIACSSLSFLVGILFFVRFFLYGMAPSGWTSLSVSIFFSTGLILFNIGVLGIYLGRVFEQGKKRPLYIIDKILNASSGV